jgi:DNA-directed RNA polymerase specialized sigma24 family protein
VIHHLDPFANIPNDLLSATIDKWVKDARNRQIMKDRLIDAMTYERIAEKHDLSVRYIKTLIYRLEDKVFEKVVKLK